MKYVYFVRHGQTQKNVSHIHQGPEEPLTAIGKEQAEAVAQTLQQKRIDTLVTSSFVRAVETAGIIGETLDLPLQKTESVKEFRRPMPLYGRSHYSLASLAYIMRLYLHRTDPHWDDHGAENMFAVRNRIVDAKKFIAGLPGERIAVVSHAIFIDMFVQAVCADRSLELKEFVSALLGAKKLPNTGIVAFSLDENAPQETCNWWLMRDETDEGYLRYR